MDHQTTENIMISESYYKSLKSDLTKLIDVKSVDPKLVAARLCAISLEISPSKSDDAMYSALTTHDFADEIVRVVESHFHKSFVDIWFSGATLPIDKWTLACWDKIFADQYCLIKACKHKLEKVAIYIISSGKINPGIVDANCETALTISCKNRLINIACALIDTGLSNPGFVDKYCKTPLLYCLDYFNTKLFNKLIATGESNPGHADTYKTTALMKVCSRYTLEMAFAIINTGQSNPGQINILSGESALMRACNFRASEIALALIDLEGVDLGHCDLFSDTPLIHACRNNMTDVALALIKSGKSNLTHCNEIGFTAMNYADLNNMTDVSDEIRNTIQNTNSGKVIKEIS